MPSPLPSSFASAAAGNTQDSASGPRRGDMSSAEWSRHRLNGATQTFRRPPVATNSSHSRESVQTTSATPATPTSGAYIPPHQSSNSQSGYIRGGSGNDNRYSKEQLLNFYKGQRDSRDVGDFFMGDWNPRDEMPTANGTWNKRNDLKDYHAGPEVCWDHTGQMRPLALTDMTEEERELFSTSVNSPLKPPPQAGSKDNVAAGGTGNRKASVSHSQSHFISSPPGSTRSGPRRRGTGDSIGNAMSPTTNPRFSRDEANTATPPSSLLRRKTDFRDSVSDAKFEEKAKDRDAAAVELNLPFGSLKRSVTNPVSAGTSGSGGPWTSTSQPSQGTGFSSMGGAFGNFSIGPITPGGAPAEKKTSSGNLRGESRFKGLLSKNSSEEMDSGKEKMPITGLDRLPETEDDPSHQFSESVAQNRMTRSETNPFDEARGGNAALGVQEVSASTGIDQFGLSSFGLPSSGGASGLRDFMHTSQQPVNQASGREPMSPTNTNPYQSPHGEQLHAEEFDTDGSDIHQVHIPNINEFRDDPAHHQPPPPPAGYTHRGGTLEESAGDRSQTSSVGGAHRGFPGLGGIGGLPSLSTPGSWPPGVSTAGGTPTRERSAFPGFGDPIFGSMADLQSPSLSTLGAGGVFGPHAGVPGSTPAGSRPSKLGSLFPTSMQNEMREQSRQEMSGNEGAVKSQDATPPEGAAALNLPFTGPLSQAPVAAAPGLTSTPGGQALADPSSQFAQNAPQPKSTGSQLPATQQRQMVMPDRMRWIYRDPQGNTQGPWSGLEMHDWFKAGFFTADLQVKKLEDVEYEPLAQLVRRIGNSREPFLVPQIGVPHGQPPPHAPAAPTFPTTGPNGGVQPPFPSSFPSFGTTLTAEQQNALERRKQEEQYLMARQKEHLAQQQALMKQMPAPSGGTAPQPMNPQQLQHHPSGQSLHSQQSYGSITSPGGIQPPPMQAPIQPPQSQGGVPGFFDAQMRQNTMPNMTPQMHAPDAAGSQDELPAMMDRLNVSRQAQFPFGGGARQGENASHSQQVATMMQDRARLQQEQEQYDMQNHADSIFDQQAREERLRQFHALRGLTEEEVALRRADGLPTHPTGLPSESEIGQNQQQHRDEAPTPADHQDQRGGEPGLSLSQQVQKAASQRQQQQQTGQIESPWKVESGMPQPFPPPPQSTSPLPAPAAQRNRQNVADALAAESRSQSQTPIEAQTTSIAPWAKEHNEAPKGPSLKEIQEAEARQAAKLEEAASAARRALAEQEHTTQPTPPAPGLPSTANWASGAASTSTPISSAGSAWAKPTAGRVQAAPNTSSAPKKTLAQIQKEEEARKQRQMAASTAASTSQGPAASPTASATKRYADLAGKVAATSTTPPAPTASSAWTTVGAGGKPKPAPSTPSIQRSVTAAASVAASAVKPRPVTTTTRSATFGSAAASNPNRAAEELAKWAKMSLAHGLNSSINVDDFVQQLLLLPPESEIISDSVYANSQTLDGRRFAEEYVRRRKLADKGIVDSATLSAGAFGPSSAEQKGVSDGWNEVAKKGPSNRDDSNANADFKVVAAKKKGKR